MGLTSIIKTMVRYGATLIFTYVFCVALWTIYMQGQGTAYHAEKLNSLNVKEVIREDSDNKNYRLPNAIVVGLSKCGTRALMYYFKIHPDTSHNLTAHLSEINFFNENYKKGLEWYKKKMIPASKGQIVMEKSPRYFAIEEVPGRMHKMNSSIKVIIIMCDPVRRAISGYSGLVDHSITDGRHLNPFEETVIDRNGNVRDRMQKGCYPEYLKRWLTYFPLKQIHFVDGDDLRRDPFPEVKKLEKFLGITDFFQRSHFVYADWKGFYCLHSPSMPTEVTCLGTTKGRPHIQVDPIVKEKLTLYFKNCNKPLFDLIHQNYTWAN